VGGTEALSGKKRIQVRLTVFTVCVDPQRRDLRYFKQGLGCSLVVTCGQFRSPVALKSRKQAVRLGGKEASALY